MKHLSDSLRQRAGAFSKGQRQVEKILQAAKDVIRDGGVENFSMNKVALRAGLRLSHVQYYFPRRSNLMHGVMQAELARFREELDHWLEGMEKGGVSPRSSLLRAVDIIFEMTKDPASTAVTHNLWAMSGYDAEIARTMDEFYVTYRETFAQMIRAANPRLRGRRLQNLTAVIVSMMEGASVLIGPGRPTHDELRDLEGEIRRAVLKLIEID